MNTQRPHSSRLYLLAPNLYATSRKTWDYWQSLSLGERRRYLGLARKATRSDDNADQSRAVQILKG
jgi:hypothetical protein